MNESAEARVDAATGRPLVEQPPAAAVGTAPTFDPGRWAGVTAIWIRELRGRMRGKRAFIFLTVYLGTLAVILWLALRTTEAMPLSVLGSVAIGRGIFSGVLLVETLVVVALAPAYSAGLISAEREKQTYDLLAVTPISSLALVSGKLLSGLSYLALVVGASLPIACLAFLFGGIEPGDVVRGYLVLAVTGIGIGSLGVWCSAALKRTQPATVAAYVLTALLVVGASATWAALDSRDPSEAPDHPPEALLYLNPFVAQLDVICQATGDACIVQQAFAPRNVNGFGADAFEPTFGPDGEPAFEAVVGPPPLPGGGAFWPKSVLVYLALGVVGLVAATQSLSPTRRWHRAGRARSVPSDEATGDD